MCYKFIWYVIYKHNLYALKHTRQKKSFFVKHSTWETAYKTNSNK